MKSENHTFYCRRIICEKWLFITLIIILLSCSGNKTETGKLRAADIIDTIGITSEGQYVFKINGDTLMLPFIADGVFSADITETNRKLFYKKKYFDTDVCFSKQTVKYLILDSDTIHCNTYNLCYSIDDECFDGTYWIISTDSCFYDIKLRFFRNPTIEI